MIYSHTSATNIKHLMNEIEIRRSEEHDLMFRNYVHATQLSRIDVFNMDEYVDFLPFVNK